MTSKLLHLQGLRALAIIFVVLFHFFPRFFPNGYLGVDQFFLLSGYLMTMMLKRNTKFSLDNVLDFFYRRVKRIVPLYYLATFMIFVSLTITPMRTWKTNYDSAGSALIFATNLVRPTGSEGYNEKLGMGVDMFTHTWSLSVEMQFYFLFPFIFYSTTIFKRSRRNIVTLLAAISLFFQTHTEEFLAFYNVFARIWQFLAGMLIFYEANQEVRRSKNTLELEESLLEKDELENGNFDQNDFKEASVRQLVTYVSLAASIALLSTTEIVSPTVGRVVIILMTALIVHVGEKCWLLENTFAVFVGEISYGWYLVHWPVCALLKMNEFTGDLYMLYGLVISFLISCIIYFIYEKRYRYWDSLKIFAVVSILLILNGNALYVISGKVPQESVLSLQQTVTQKAPFSKINVSIYNYESDFLNTMLYGYENKTNEERAKLNDAMSAGDSKQTRTYPCTKQPTNSSREVRCLSEFNNTSTNYTLLVMGNSYTGNAMTTILNACGDVFQKIYSTWIPTCTSLVRDKKLAGGVDCSIDWFFMEAVRQYRPDYVFLVNRLIDVNVIDKGTNPFNDRIWKEMVDRLNELESLVTRKVYILDTFEWPPNNMGKRLSAFLRKGEKFEEQDFFNPNHKEWYPVAKRRMSRLAKICKKCELFDYTEQFFIDGKLHYFDPKYHVSFFTYPLHVSPVGLARVAPLYHHICHNL